MRTLAFQSYRPHGVPRFLERSMASVREWARSRGHDYRFLDDRFFDVLPAWYRERVGDNKLVLANLARLVVARQALDEGYDRAIWIDADVLVYVPDRFDPQSADGFAFCRETWVERRGFQFVPQFRVNNAVCVFDRGNRMLDFAIWAHEALVRDRPDRIQQFGTSTTLLTQLYMVSPLPLLHDVALTTPPMLLELAGAGDGPALQTLRRGHGAPMHAANLSGSMIGAPNEGVVATEAHADAAVDRLLRTRGGVLAEPNAHAPAVASAQSRGTR